MNLLLFNLKTDADDTVLGFTTDWINVLAEHFDHITVITMMTGRIAVAPNVEVFSVGKEKGWSEPRRAVEFYLLLWHALRNRRFDACFAHMMPLFALMGSPLLKVHNIPVTLWYAHSHVSLILGAATQLVDRVVTASKSGFRIETPKLEVLGHGIDAARFERSPMPSQRARFIVLTVGRVSPIKRLEILIRAVSLLDEKTRARIKVRFVGDTLTESDKAYKVALLKQIAENGLDDLMEFQAGAPFHCIHEIYQNADFFINSSDTDSVDKSVLEAMSMGLAVVTSNIAFCDVLGAKLAEKWVVPKNDAQIMAERLRQLVNLTSAERTALGATLRDIVVREHSLPLLMRRLAPILKGRF